MFVIKCFMTKRYINKNVLLTENIEEAKQFVSIKMAQNFKKEYNLNTFGYNIVEYNFERGLLNENKNTKR